MLDFGRQELAKANINFNYYKKTMCLLTFFSKDPRALALVDVAYLRMEQILNVNFDKILKAANIL